jgi:dihydroorotase
MDTLDIIRPDDWHLHLRDGAGLGAVVAHTAERFARAIVMPNLKPPVATVAQAEAYRARILEAAGHQHSSFRPLMTLYLTPQTSRQDVRDAAAAPDVHAIKLYPAGATTNSDAAVSQISTMAPVFEEMERVDLPLLIHGEVTDPDIDVFDREARFIEETLAPLHARHPELRIVFEHVTTSEAVDFVSEATDRVAATITPQHLLLNRNDLFAGGLQPDHYCLPILKRATHQQALLAAATGGSPRFFLGTDSAPHAREAKYSACGCAGCYSSFAGIELYAEVFEAHDALDKLEGFASLHGPKFYGLEPNQDRIRLVREPWIVPDTFPFGDSVVVPLRAGTTIAWRLDSGA